MNSHYSKAFLLLFATMILFSCLRTYQVGDSDKKFIRYKGDEMLVFGNDQYYDTLRLRGFESFFTKTSDSISAYNTESYLLNYNSFKDSIYITFLVELTALRNNEVGISFNMHQRGKNRTFKRSIKLKEFENTCNQKFYLKGVSLNDVAALRSKWNDTTSLIQTLYWSKSKGLVGYALNDSTVFKLIATSMSSSIPTAVRSESKDSSLQTE